MCCGVAIVESEFYMRIRPGAFLQGRTTTLREACCLLPPPAYSVWSRRVNAAGPGAIFSLPLSCSAEDPTPRAKYGSELSAGASKRKREDLGIKELFLDVLGATATKREAKTYLSRFRSETPGKLQALPKETRKDNVGVNLGNLYVPIRAVDQTPVFEQGPSKAQYVDQIAGPLHTALVKIRDTQAIDDRTLRAVGLTLVQLSRLGMSSVVVVDGERKMLNNDPGVRRSAIEQADRVAAAIDEHGGHGARRLDNVLTTTDVNEGCRRSSLKIRSGTHVTNRDLILNPLRKGKIPVVVPVAFNSRTQALVHVTADEAMLTLTRDFAGLRPGVLPEFDPQAAAEKVESMQKEISIDRIIILDPVGGLPAIDKQDQCHVFINLEQEYDAIKTELSTMTVGTVESNKTETRLISKKGPHSMLTSGNPFLAFGEAQSSFTANAESTKPGSSTIASHVTGQAKVHLQNLKLLRDGLAMLPPSSSGLLTTAQKAANSDRSSQDSFSTPGVGTRRQRNALIHNLLTDKPDFSSSLPLRRTQQPISTTDQTIFINPATFFKRGMPITIIPDPRTQPWQSPSPSSSSISLSDPRLDLPRLLHLIEDSFNRKLDVPHYLSRIEDRIAGIIIAGEYEGGALLTWESPPSKPSIMVPYLDKFAVLKRSQGAGGVADIVFNAMVRTCFPDGVCWRSRRDNPVNKWYFERARGTWKIPASNWTMFWTTEGVQAGDGKGVFGDYESVCRGVVPSWADNKSVID